MKVLAPSRPRPIIRPEVPAGPVQESRLDYFRRCRRCGHRAPWVRRCPICGAPGRRCNVALAALALVLLGILIFT
jgi:hypothetical protein